MDFNDFLNKDDNTVKPLAAGGLLLASPLLQEPYFRRGAVMLLDVNQRRGCLGLVLNKESTVTLGDITGDIGDVASMPLFCGGPVEQGRLFLLHTLGDAISGSTLLLPGLYVGGDYNEAFRYLEMGGEWRGKMRFFLGYSGWTEGQLEHEIADKAWAVDPNPDSGLLLDGKGDSYWRREVTLMGEDYRSWLLMPDNPAMN